MQNTVMTVGNAVASECKSSVVESTDGVTVAVHDFGGDGPALLLAHATGFHGMVFTPLVKELRSSFHCIAFDQRCHGASSRPRPASFSFAWSSFADDVLAVVHAMDLEQPSAFGHSSGGAALLLAEERRPGTFRDLFCYEPVVLDVAGPLPPEGLPDNPLTRAALKRQEVFESRDQAFDNFSRKPPLSSMSPEALTAYVDHGLIARPAGGFRLACRRDDEAEIYAQGFAHDAFQRLDTVSCPVTLAYGAETTSIGAGLIEAMAKKLPSPTVMEMPNLGHLGPLEDPHACADAIVAAHRRINPADSPVTKQQSPESPKTRTQAPAP